MNQDSHHVAFCPHCGNRSSQKVAYEHSYRDRWYGSNGQELPEDEGPDSEAILCICQTCNAVLLYDGISYHESGIWPDLAYPRDATLPASVAETVRQIYREASIVKRNAPNAFAMLIRKALEAICDDRRAPAGSLAARLRHLATAGELPPALSEVTDVLRVVGNSAAHGSLQTITPPMTWAIDDFFRVVVEYVYIAPSKLAEFKNTVASLGNPK